MTATLKKCQRCASSVPVEASVCAHCRAKLPIVGPTWWEASDGIMYPPHAHPDFGKRPLPPKQPMTTRNKVLIGVAALIGAGWLVAAIAGGAAEEEDILGREACEEFADLRDIELYTVDELRTQVQQVYRDGQYADSAAIRSASRELVAAVTSGDPARFAAAAADMADACAAL